MEIDPSSKEIKMLVKIRGNEYNTVAEQLAAIHHDHLLLSIQTKVLDKTVNHINLWCEF
jgi:hypothetical protein